MAALDPTVAAVLDRPRTTDSDDEDALIASLEEDSDTAATLDHLRARRIEQLHAEMTKAKTIRESAGHGIYQEIKDEKALMDITTSTARCVVHFMKPDFARCRTMEARLAALAERHFEVRFVGINVENAPFLVVKLGIQVLPVVVAFKDAVGVERVIGFEGVGRRGDDVEVGMLEARLVGCGALVRAKIGEGGEEGVRRRKEVKEREEEWDDDEWD